MTRPTRIEICAGGCDEDGTKPKCGKCGVEQVIELTDAEIAQMEADAQAAATRKAEEEAQAAADAVAKQAILDRLGLTAEEAALLLK